jgi:hypothetical protein
MDRGRQPAAALQAGVDRAGALRKPPDEVGRVEFVDGRLGALEGQLRQALLAEPPAAGDSEERPVAGRLDLTQGPPAVLGGPGQAESFEFGPVPHGGPQADMLVGAPLA